MNANAKFWQTVVNNLEATFETRMAELAAMKNQGNYPQIRMAELQAFRAKAHASLQTALELGK